MLLVGSNRISKGSEFQIGAITKNVWHCMIEAFVLGTKSMPPEKEAPDAPTANQSRKRATEFLQVNWSNAMKAVPEHGSYYVAVMYMHLM